MYSAIAANKRNTFIIIAGFVLLLGGISLWWGYSTGNGSSAIFILLFVIGYAVFQYFMAGRLAIAMSGAKEIQKQDNPRLYRMVENLAITEGLPMPKVYIINDPAPNAFATGRDPKHGIVAATTGLLELMDDNELEGVMAHEIGHIKNHDIRVSTIVFGLNRGSRNFGRYGSPNGLLLIIYALTKLWSVRADPGCCRDSRLDYRSFDWTYSLCCSVTSARVFGGCHRCRDNPLPRWAGKCLEKAWGIWEADEKSK